MSNVDFTAILGKQVGTAPEPKPLPSGTYMGVVEGLPTSRIVNTKEGPKGVLTVTVGITEAMDDVDEGSLAEAGGLLRNDGNRKTIRADFWLDEGSLFRLDQFLAGFGWTADSGKTYQDALEELPGKEVTVALESREYQTKSGETRTATDVKRIHANA